MRLKTVSIADARLKGIRVPEAVDEYQKTRGPRHAPLQCPHSRTYRGAKDRYSYCPGCQHMVRVGFVRYWLLRMPMPLRALLLSPLVLLVAVVAPVAGICVGVWSGLEQAWVVVRDFAKLAATGK